MRQGADLPVYLTSHPMPLDLGCFALFVAPGPRQLSEAAELASFRGDSWAARVGDAGRS